MVERPILFSGAMVRAILDGRKTQTRRVVKHENASEIDCWAHAGCGEWEAGSYVEGSTAGMGMMRCPFGGPGDRLWVRETFVYRHKHDRYYYRADHPKFDPYAHDGWKPSIHMPRRACRLTLEVMGVRVERLCDVSEEDAVAEGVEVHMMPEEWRAVRQQHGRNKAITFDREPSADLIAALRLRDVTHVPARPMRSAVSGFSSLWESINGRGSWDANPWVWVVEFRRVTP